MYTSEDFKDYKQFCAELNRDYCTGGNELLDAGIIYSLSLYLMDNRPELKEFLTKQYPGEKRDLAGLLARDVLSVEQSEEEFLLSA